MNSRALKADTWLNRCKSVISRKSNAPKLSAHGKKPHCNIVAATNSETACDCVAHGAKTTSLSILHPLFQS